MRQSQNQAEAAGHLASIIKKQEAMGTCFQLTFWVLCRSRILAQRRMPPMVDKSSYLNYCNKDNLPQTRPELYLSGDSKVHEVDN